ncbi:MAG: 2-C-methyl-D-erythritol 4-phosphate cytidylyltransferase [Mariprofundales bacterium]
MNSDLPKQYILLDNKPLLLHTLKSLAAVQGITAVLPVLAAGDDLYQQYVCAADYPFLLPAVIGGSERALSMQAGLNALPKNIQWIAVHDAARPFPSIQLLNNLFAMALQYGAAVPGMAVTDTIKQVDVHGKVIRTLVRKNLRAVQTPQMARRDWLEDAIKQAGEKLASFTDDVSLLEAAGYPVHISAGEAANRKITTPDDWQWAEQYIDSRDNRDERA